MYCSHCGKKVGEDMLFCPFCGKPIVIPEQDDKPASATDGETLAAMKEPEPGNAAFSSEEKAEAIEEEAPEEQKKPTSALIEEGEHYAQLLLQSDANNLDLSLDMIRIFVINDRAGLYE